MFVKNLNKNKFVCEMAEEITPPVTEVPVVETPPVTEVEVPVPPVVEKPVEEAPKVNPDLEKFQTENVELKSEIERLKSELATKVSNVNTDETTLNELNSLKTSNEQVVAKTEAYEKVLTEIVESKMALIPENLKELVPQTSSLTDQLSWLNKAEQSGLFGNNKHFEIGKPMNPNAPTEEVDMSKLSATSLLSIAYGSKK